MRVQVKYVDGVNSHVKEPRWMDTKTGDIYDSQTSTIKVAAPHCTPIGLDVFTTTAKMSTVRTIPTLDPIMDAAPTTEYADGNPKAAQGAKKHTLRLLPLPAAVVVNQALDDGRIKYGAANWRETGVAASVYVDACKRHLEQWFDGGQELAADSGVHNLGHAMACLAIIIDAQWNNRLIDDRPAPCRDTDLLLLRSKP